MQLNHVFIRTSDLGAMTSFFTEIVGLEVGYRPPFSFPGAWLYSNGQALIHLAEESTVDPASGIVGHIAFTGDDYTALVETLDDHDIAYDERNVPLTGERQVFVTGPDGLLVEIQFAAGAKNK